MHNKSTLGIHYKLAMFQVSNHIRWTLFFTEQTYAIFKTGLLWKYHIFSIKWPPTE